MKKLNSVVYHKLLLQAEEAKNQNMIKLSSAILGSLGPIPEEEGSSYNYGQLQEDVYQGLWKLATCIIKYHDLDSADAGKIHELLESLSSKIIEDLETSLGVDNTHIGPLEDKVPGQSE